MTLNNTMIRNTVADSETTVLCESCHIFIQNFTVFEVSNTKTLVFKTSSSIYLKHTIINFITDIKPKYPLVYKDHLQNDRNMTNNIFNCPIGFIGKTIHADGYVTLACEKCPPQTYILTGGIIDNTNINTSPPFRFEPIECDPCQSGTNCNGGK